MPSPFPLAIKAVPGQGNGLVADFTGMGTQNGDIRVFEARSQASPAADITPPTGWVRAGTVGTFASDRFLGRFIKLITNVATEPLTYTFTGIAGGGNSRIEGHIYLVRGADPAFINEAGQRFQPNATLPATTAIAAPYTVFGVAGAEFTAGNSAVPTIPSDYTNLLTSQTEGGTTAAVIPNTNTTNSRTGLTTIYKRVESGSLSIPAVPFTWAGTATDPKSASWVVRGLATATPIGVPVKLASGTAYLSYIDGAGVRKAPASVNIWLPGFSNVTALLAKNGATMSHRGGSLNWPEYSQYAYDHSVFQGIGVLEFSCDFTSDLVPFGQGYQYMDDAAGTTGNVLASSMTWATLSSTLSNRLRPVSAGVYQPFYRLDQFLQKYTPNHVCLVDPKFGAGTAAKINAMLDVCDANGGPSKIIIKWDSPLENQLLVNSAKARGYTTMNYWGTEIEKLTPQYGSDRWDLIGVRYDANQAMYDAALALGKPVWAAVIPDQAGYNLAASRGARLMMIANSLTIAPVGP